VIATTRDVVIHLFLAGRPLLSSTTSGRLLSTRALSPSKPSARPAPWFILASFVRVRREVHVYRELQHICARGVYRVVKEAMGSTPREISVSALMFDYILTGPISGVSAGQYLTGFLNDFSPVDVNLTLPINSTSCGVCHCVTIYSGGRTSRGIPESSGKRCGSCM